MRIVNLWGLGIGEKRLYSRHYQYTNQGDKLTFCNADKVFNNLICLDTDNGLRNGIKPISPDVFEKNKKGKTGRNELCPCGRGKKYKKCCGENRINIKIISEKSKTGKR